MQPRRARGTDSDRLNELEIKVKQGVDRIQATADPIPQNVINSYYMTSNVDGLYGKFPMLISGKIIDGAIICNGIQKDEKPEIVISLIHDKSTTSFTTKAKEGLVKLDIPKHFKVEKEDILSVTSEGAQSVSTLSLAITLKPGNSE